MSVEYREFRDTDFFPMWEWEVGQWTDVHRNAIASLSEPKNAVVKGFVALINDTVVGYIYGFALPNHTLIPELLYVRHEFRNQGIGTNLLRILENNSGCNVSMIFYHKSLHDYYEKLGYETGSNLETAIKDIPPAME